MKTEYKVVFGRHIKAAIVKAESLGGKASWQTEKHLEALAEVCTENVGSISEVLKECYNISQLQQDLEKVFKEQGHFQRAKKAKVADEVSDWVKMSQG